MLHLHREFHQSATAAGCTGESGLANRVGEVGGAQQSVARKVVAGRAAVLLVVGSERMGDRYFVSFAGGFGGDLSDVRASWDRDDAQRGRAAFFGPSRDGDGP